MENNDVILNDVIMTQSHGLRSTLPESAPDGQLLIARNPGFQSELWCGTGDGVEQLLGSGGSGGSSTSFDVNKQLHGFNKVFVSFNGEDWIKAYANTATSDNTVVNSTIGFAVMKSSNVFTVITSGKVVVADFKDVDNNPLIPGEYYYLCQEFTNAGKVTKQKPVGGTSQIVMQALSETEIIVSIQEPFDMNEAQYGGSQRIDFTAGNISDNKVTLNHILKSTNVLVEVYDDNNVKVEMSGRVKIVNNGAVLLDLSGMTVSGIWHAIIQGGVIHDIIDRNKRNIGELVYSLLPIDDVGMHLCDGTLISGPLYQGFVDMMEKLVRNNPNGTFYTSESDWQTSVSTYGVCGKFVVDSTNHTVRLPKVTGFIEGTIDPNSLGALTPAGLPNVWGTISHAGGGAGGGAFNSSWSVGALTVYFNGINNLGVVGTSFNANAVSSIYGASSTVQPQSIKGYIYICIANAVTSEVPADISYIVESLQNKADRDLSNCTRPYIISTYQNGASWYRVYSDGWCEQGGLKSVSGSTDVSLLKTYGNNNYSIFVCRRSNNYNAAQTNPFAEPKNASIITINCGGGAADLCQWEAKGYLS